MTPTPPTMPVRDLVAALGGPQALADALGITPTAVCCWYGAGVPARHHLALWCLALDAGLPWQPPGTEDWRLLRLAAPAPARAA